MQMIQMNKILLANFPFMTLCPTRWLVRGEVLHRLLGNWSDLKAYFSSAAFDQSSRYKARTISDMLFDDVNYLYCCFITPIVKEFDKINKYFQATDADPEAMSQQLHMHYASLKGRVYDDGNELSISRIDFGSKFLSEALRCSLEHQNNSEFAIQLQNVKERCKRFLQDLIVQVEARLPANKEIFSGLSLLKPSKVLSHVHRASFSQLPFHHLLADSSETEEQYRKILLQPWSEEDVFQEKVPEGAVDFWVGVYDFKDCTGIYAYRQLAAYALACLSTPVSNAFVERVFSYVNAIKTERRNNFTNPNNCHDTK